MSTTAPELPTSVPRYASAEPCQQASDHLLVSQGPGLTQRAALNASLPGAQVRHLALTDYPGQAELQHALLAQLHAARVGLRLYLQGDESFIWPLHALARGAGLQEDEIELLGSASEQRAIYCVHCASLQPGGNEDRLSCAQCGVVLEVRRHFSRRLGAYLGVCADADQPYQEARP